LLNMDNDHYYTKNPYSLGNAFYSNGYLVGRVIYVYPYVI